MSASFLAPENTSNVSIQHQQFKVDANRVLTVPDHLADHVRALGWPPTTERSVIEVSTRARPQLEPRAETLELLGTTPTNPPVVSSGKPAPPVRQAAATAAGKGDVIDKNAPTPGDTTGASTITDKQINEGEKGAK